jgi:hypothetical protein
VLPARAAADSGRTCENGGDLRPWTGDRDKSQKRLLFENSALPKKIDFYGTIYLFHGRRDMAQSPAQPFPQPIAIGVSLVRNWCAI